jgi:hypothetical protein
MRLENFKAEDYYQLEQPEGRGLENWMDLSDIPAALLRLEEMGVSRSVWLGDRLYAIYGLIERRQGVAEVYFLPSRNWTRKVKSICRFIKNDLEAIMHFFNRVQMTCLEEDSFLRFSKFFGFKKEGSLERYDKLGRTYAMLAIIRQGGLCG